MTKRFVSPPNWPTAPPGWEPPPGWRPDPHWGPAPTNWQFWQEKPRRGWFARHKLPVALVTGVLVTLVGLFGLGAVGIALSGSSTLVSASSQSTDPWPTATEAPRSSQEPTSTPGPVDSSSARAAADKLAKDRAASKREAEVKAAKVEAAKRKVAAVKAAEAKAAEIKAAKIKAAKVKAAQAKAAMARAAEAKAARAKAARIKAAKAEAARVKAAKEKEAVDTSGCTPGYSPCLPYASDYDCAAGSGNGPEYVYEPVRVFGSDPYDLDRDGDGVGCDN